MIRTYQESIDHLLETQVRPWAEKLPWHATHPVAYDGSEGYKGEGVFGSRAGPMDSIGFKNVAHEMAHAIEILECGRTKALFRNGWGLDIKTSVIVAGVPYEEPATMQATEREARVCGIQWRILEMVEHPGMMGFASRQATILGKFMPDWIFGGDSEDQRHACRVRLIKDSYDQWLAARVAAAWRAAHPLLLEAALKAKPKADTTMRAARRRMG